LVVPALVNDRHEPSPINTTFSLWKVGKYQNL
jgi:hypothetical protein